MSSRPVLLLFIVFSNFLHKVNPCQSSIGGTCVGGTAYGMDYSYVDRIETCANDINKDWCVVVFKENIQQTDFHCFNYYNTIPVLGGKVCGNAPWDINSGGCDRVSQFQTGILELS